MSNQINSQPIMHSNSKQTRSSEQSNGQPVQSDNLNKELNEWNKKAINDETEQPGDLDIETNDETANDDRSTSVASNKKQQTSTSTENGSLDPTKLDMKIIHVPVSFLKKLVQSKRKK